MNIVLTLSDFADFIEKTFGLGKPLSFYQNLARIGRLKNSYLANNNRYYVKIDACVYQAKDMQAVIDENIRLKEKLNNIKKMID